MSSLHQTHTTGQVMPGGPDYGYVCTCGARSYGFPTRERARNAGDNHLNEAMGEWFINEDGEPYPFRGGVETQTLLFPGDDHTPYATLAEAEAAAGLEVHDEQ